MSTELAKPEPIRYEASEIELVKKTIAAGATEDELRLFLYDCRRQNVHPLDKLVHFSKRGGKYTPITSIDFMRMRAAADGDHAGTDDPVFDIDDNSDKLPRWSKVTVYKLVQGHKCPFTATARWSEYCPGRENEAFMWRKMPRLMLGKCAEALALRKAFPKQLHGIYEKAEMMQADDGARSHEDRGERTRETVSGGGKDGAPKLPPPTSTSPEDLRPESEVLFPDPQADVERERLLTEIRSKAEKAKIPRKDRDDAWNTYCGTATPSNADLAALADLLKWVETRAR